eukprot:Rmarinus@m.2570
MSRSVAGFRHLISQHRDGSFKTDDRKHAWQSKRLSPLPDNLQYPPIRRRHSIANGVDQRRPSTSSSTSMGGESRDDLMMRLQESVDRQKEELMHRKEQLSSIHLGMNELAGMSEETVALRNRISELVRENTALIRRCNELEISSASSPDPVSAPDVSALWAREKEVQRNAAELAQRVAIIKERERELDIAQQDFSDREAHLAHRERDIETQLVVLRRGGVLEENSQGPGKKSPKRVGTPDHVREAIKKKDESVRALEVKLNEMVLKLEEAEKKQRAAETLASKHEQQLLEKKVTLEEKENVARQAEDAIKEKEDQIRERNGKLNEMQEKLFAAEMQATRAKEKKAEADARVAAEVRRANDAEEDLTLIRKRMSEIMTQNAEMKLSQDRAIEKALSSSVEEIKSLRDRHERQIVDMREALRDAEMSKKAALEVEKEILTRVRSLEEDIEARAKRYEEEHGKTTKENMELRRRVEEAESRASLAEKDRKRFADMFRQMSTSMGSPQKSGPTIDGTISSVKRKKEVTAKNSFRSESGVGAGGASVMVNIYGQDLKSRVEVMAEEIMKITVRCSELSTQLEVAEEAKKQVTRVKEQLERQVETAKGRETDFTQQFKKHRDLEAKHRKDIADLHSQLSTKNETIAALREEKDALSMEVKKLRESVDDELAAIREEREAILLERSQWEEKLKSVENELRMEIATSQTELEKTKHSLNNAREETTRCRESFEKELAQARRDSAALLEKTRTECEIDKENLKQKLAKEHEVAIAEEKQKVQCSLKAEIQSSKDTANGLMRELTSRRDELFAVSMDRDKLKERVQQLEEDVSAVRKHAQLITEREARLDAREKEFITQKETTASAVVTLDEIQSAMEGQLTCMMCMKVMVNPVTLQPCGHNYCETCITQNSFLNTLHCEECGVGSRIQGSVKNEALEALCSKFSHAKETVATLRKFVEIPKQSRPSSRRSSM